MQFSFQIIVKQEITRKVGVALSPEEEELRSKLENMQALVQAPTQYKGRLSELLSQMRMQRNQWNLTNTVDYALDPGESACADRTIGTLWNLILIFCDVPASRFGRRNEVRTIDASEGDVRFNRNGQQRYGNPKQYL